MNQTEIFRRSEVPTKAGNRDENRHGYLLFGTIKRPNIIFKLCVLECLELFHHCVGVCLILILVHGILVNH